MPESNLLNERQAAKRLGLSVATLRRRRLLGWPPIYVKISARVLYREEDLTDFVAVNVVRPDGTSHQPPEAR